MKIKKIGHCCLLIKIDGLTVLTDPGSFSVGQNSIEDIDIVLVTHEHADHLHVDSLKEVMRNNPHAQIVTNSSVGKKLDELGIAYTVLEGRNSVDLKSLRLEAFDGRHEEIFGEIGQVQNTGYFIGGKLFYPGDSYCNPGKPVDILALPGRSLVQGLGRYQVRTGCKAEKSFSCPRWNAAEGSHRRISCNSGQGSLREWHRIRHHE